MIAAWVQMGPLLQHLTGSMTLFVRGLPEVVSACFGELWRAHLVLCGLCKHALLECPTGRTHSNAQNGILGDCLLQIKDTTIKI